MKCYFIVRENNIPATTLSCKSDECLIDWHLALCCCLGRSSTLRSILLTFTRLLTLVSQSTIYVRSSVLRTFSMPYNGHESRRMSICRSSWFGISRILFFTGCRCCWWKHLLMAAQNRLSHSTCLVECVWRQQQNNKITSKQIERTERKIFSNTR